MTVRQTCRQYRIIPIADLPKVDDPETGERDATGDELANMGIMEFDRGDTNVQALCVGYWCDTRQCAVNAQNEPWPGILIAGKVGLYGKRRFPQIRRNLETYKGGSNGGRTRLMQTALPEESEGEGPDGEVIPARPMSEEERLKRRVPRVMGD